MLNFASEAEAKTQCKGSGVRLWCYDPKDREWRSPTMPDKATRAFQEARSKLQEEYRVASRAAELQRMRDSIAALKK